jgi:anti-sigma regulatory factor (Ser/Thr protein kinase)
MIAMPHLHATVANTPPSEQPCIQPHILWLDPNASEQAHWQQVINTVLPVQWTSNNPTLSEANTFSPLITTANTLEDALQHIKTTPLRYDVLLLDPLFDEAPLNEFQKTLQALPNAPFRTVLFTKLYPIDYLPIAHQFNAYQVLVKQQAHQTFWLKKELLWLCNPFLAFGIDPLIANQTLHQQWCIDSSQAIQETYNSLLETLAQTVTTEIAMDVGTSLMEALTNAVYHAIVNDEGQEVYQKGQFIETLPPSQQVRVTLKLNKQAFAISVHDQGGVLSPSQVLYWMHRNHSGDGLFDTSGRGLFLMHALMDRCLINIEQGKQTELVLYRQYASKENDEQTLIHLENKPLFINIR